MSGRHINAPGLTKALRTLETTDSVGVDSIPDWDKLDEQKKEFLFHYVRLGSKEAACKHMEVAPLTVDRWYATNSIFQEAHKIIVLNPHLIASAWQDRIALHAIDKLNTGIELLDPVKDFTKIQALVQEYNKRQGLTRGEMAGPIIINLNVKPWAPPREVIEGEVTVR